MRPLRIIGAQAACGTNVGGASTFENATEVRLVNTGAAEALVTVANSADTTIATFTLETLDTIVIEKGASDQVFAAAATVLGAPCNARR
jgi:hypothetical protein